MWSYEPFFIALVIVTGAAVAVVFRLAFRKELKSWSDMGQGLMGIVAVLALIGGLWIYYLEGGDNAKVDISAKTTVAPLAPGEIPNSSVTRSASVDDAQPRVLVQFVGTVTNKGAFPENFQCIGVDVRGFKQDMQVQRHRVFHSDMETDGLVPPEKKDTEWARCMGFEKKRWVARQDRRLKRLGLPETERITFAEPDSGLRYQPHVLEPGEPQTYDLELVVPCDMAAIRINFFVPKPEQKSVREAKTLVSLRHPCGISRQWASSIPEEATGAPSATVEFGNGDSEKTHAGIVASRSEISALSP